MNVDVKIDKFAPVIIPTLCRYTHFTRCIESLAKCKFSNMTDVFVALDYPAKEIHWDGYLKICEYLEVKQTELCFKSLNVIKRERNYGLGKNGNASSLIKDISKKYDRWIFSEDDNCFSPNFLVYLNFGLSYFEGDKTVLAINAYRHYYPIKKDYNSFYRQNVDFSAWGYAIWKEKNDLLRNLDKNYFKRKCSLKNIFYIYKNKGLNRVLDLLSYAYSNKCDIRITDNVMSVYMELENLNVIMPTLSLVRNMGFDGSGEHCNNVEVADQHLNQEISSDDNFTFKGTGYEYYKENQLIHRKYSYGKITLIQFFSLLIKSITRIIINKIQIQKKIFLIR